MLSNQRLLTKLASFDLHSLVLIYFDKLANRNGLMSLSKYLKKIQMVSKKYFTQPGFYKMLRVPIYSQNKTFYV